MIEKICECGGCGLVKPIRFNDNMTQLPHQECPSCGSDEWKVM